MKLILIGSHLCQDTLYALNKLKDGGADIFSDRYAYTPSII